MGNLLLYETPRLKWNLLIVTTNPTEEIAKQTQVDTLIPYIIIPLVSGHIAFLIADDTVSLRYCREFIQVILTISTYVLNSTAISINSTRKAQPKLKNYHT